MTRVTLHFDSLPANMLATLLAACSKSRDGFSPSNHSGLSGVAAWEPVVTCNGPSHYAVTVPPCDVTTAMFIISEMDGPPTVTQVREALACLDGTNASVVSLLTGFTRAELDSLGGVPQ